MRSHARLVPTSFVVLGIIVAAAEHRSALAQVGDAGALTGRVTVQPWRTLTPPTVDGLLDDAVWTDAARITEFVQRQPLDGAPATEDTDVYVAYDDRRPAGGGWVSSGKSGTRARRSCGPPSPGTSPGFCRRWGSSTG